MSDIFHLLMTRHILVGSILDFFLHEIIYEMYSRMGSTRVLYTTEIQIISSNGEIGIDIRKWCLSTYSKMRYST